jgi:ribose-phosphate pyrophosphokinase
MMEASLAAQTARDYGAKSVMLVATYLPYMRQDIHFNPLESRSAMFLKEFFRQFDKVLAIDPHLHRIRTLKEISSKAKEISAKALIAEFVRENFAEDFQIVGPDSESKQWGAEIAHSLGKDAIILRKQRFSSFNVHVRDHDLGKKVLIIDDIISTGRTLLQTIRIARRHGAKKIYCIGIHGILLADSAELIGKYAEIITTNSVPNKFAKIDVSPIISAELKKIKK